jgi:hypothetical protein
VYGRMGKTKGFIKPLALGGGMGGGMGGWVVGGMGLRVGFININDMYNNDVGKGVVYAYEAYEVK